MVSKVHFCLGLDAFSQIDTSASFCMTSLRDTKKYIEELQKDLTRLESWSNDWQLKFNTDKCEVMRISKKNDYSSPQYHLSGNQLKAVSEAKDLGIYITSNLS